MHFMVREGVGSVAVGIFAVRCNGGDAVLTTACAFMARAEGLFLLSQQASLSFPPTSSLVHRSIEHCCALNTKLCSVHSAGL